MSKALYEYDTGHRYGPASDVHEEKFRAALAMGRPFFLYPAYGYHFRMVVKEETEKADTLSDTGPSSPSLSAT